MTRENIASAIEVLKVVKTHHVMEAAAKYGSVDRTHIMPNEPWVPNVHKAESIQDAIVELSLWMEARK